MESNPGKEQLPVYSVSDELVLEAEFLYLYGMCLTLIGAALLQLVLASCKNKTEEQKMGLK